MKSKLCFNPVLGSGIWKYRSASVACKKVGIESFYTQLFARLLTSSVPQVIQREFPPASTLTIFRSWSDAYLPKEHVWEVVLTNILELDLMGSMRGLGSLKRRIKDLMNFIP